MRIAKVRFRYSISFVLLLTAAVALGLQLTLPRRGLIGTWVPINSLNGEKGFQIRFDGKFSYIDSDYGKKLGRSPLPTPYTLSTVEGEKFIDFQGEYGREKKPQHCKYRLKDDTLIIDAIDPPQRIFFHWKLKRAK